MGITRRDFLKYCGLSAAALGLSRADVLRLGEVLANPNGPTVIWLQGSGCTGCSMSFLNRISRVEPATAADVLIKSINLVYHPNLMAVAGQDAAAIAEQAYSGGGYVLAVEGGVPTAFEGAACWAWTYDGVDVTFQEAVTDLASRAAYVLCIGTCASWGGIPAAGANPAGIKSVQDVTGKTTINIGGCPPHPDWIVWPIAQVLLGKSIPLDGSGRPTALFTQTVHEKCSRQNEDNCLWNAGCRGPGAHAGCSTLKWNNGVNWCVGANAPCYACTEPDFPGSISLYTPMYNPHGDANLNCQSCHGASGSDIGRGTTDKTRRGE
jgi:hydrogenase small subunit